MLNSSLKRTFQQQFNHCSTIVQPSYPRRYFPVFRLLCHMYSRQEASRLKQEFWTTLGQYMNPVLSAEGEKVNWINYKTGERNIYFRMRAENTTASLAIQIRHKDPLIRQVFYEHFLSLKNMFTSQVDGEWDWYAECLDEHGMPLSRISLSLQEVNIFKKDDWPEMIRFFKTGMIQLDQFWTGVKFSFELLH